MENKLSKTLKQLQKEKNLTDRAVAKACSIPQSSYAHIMSGRTKDPKVEYLIRLSKYFNRSIDFLLTGKAPKNNSIEEFLTEGLYEGYLKVKVERVIESQIKKKNEDD